MKPAYQPDPTDWAIIGILAEKDTPNSRIAARLGLSEGTVRNRLKKLRAHGVLRIRALINPEVLPDRQLAIIGINVQESRLLEAKSAEITALNRVLSVAIVSGRYDLLVEVLVESNHGLVRFVTEDLATIDGIRTTETFVALKTYQKFV